MSIYGIPGSTIPTALPARPDAATARARAEQRPAIAPPSGEAQPVNKGAHSSGAAAALPVQAPPGTDPTLWNVLNAEERAFFAKVGAMGPLTYGRVLSGQMAAPTSSMRGGRLDLKV
jgi:hypothetical protein